MMNLEKAKFTIGDSGTIFSGFHDPAKRWNGFAMPLFEIETAKYIAIMINSTLPDCYFVRRNSSNTGFSVLDKEQCDSSEILDYEVEVNGKSVMVVDFLSGSWAWELANDS